MRAVRYYSILFVNGFVRVRSLANQIHYRKNYRETAARILLTGAVMLRTRTVIKKWLTDFVRILAIIFAVFVLETAPSIFHLERNPSNG